MYIPNCGTACPLKKMFELFKNFMPILDRDEECKLSRIPENALKLDFKLNDPLLQHSNGIIKYCKYKNI